MLEKRAKFVLIFVCALFFACLLSFELTWWTIYVPVMVALAYPVIALPFLFYRYRQHAASGPGMKFVAGTSIGLISFVIGLFFQLVVDYFLFSEWKRQSFWRFFDSLQSGDAAIVWLPEGVLYLLIAVPIIIKKLKRFSGGEKVSPTSRIVYSTVFIAIAFIPLFGILFFVSSLIFSLSWWYLYERRSVVVVA